MTVVIDIGCARHGNDYSIERLIEEFHPKHLFGFDPHESIVDKSFVVHSADERGAMYETVVHLRRQAAWLYDGEIGFLSDGLNSCLSDRDDKKVTCFDLARWIYEEMPATDTDGTISQVVLKMDAEGSEYDLLDRLIELGYDKLIHIAWIEWHPFGVEDPEGRRKRIEDNIDKNVDLKEWRW